MRIATLYGPLQIGSDYLRLIPASKMDQAWPPLLDRRFPHNIGDWFVTKIADRLLDYDELVIVPKNATDREWDLVNQTCQALVLKGGNFIQSNWLSTNYGFERIKKCKIPIVMIGAGLQAPSGERVEFTDEEADILRYIHDGSACSSVRGISTAEALAAIGITNVVVTGCPTLFWSRRPRITVRAPHDESAGFSFRQGLFTADPQVYRAQFRAIEIVRNQFRSVTVFLQGEEVILQNYLQARRWEAEYVARSAPLPGTSLVRLERKPLDAADLRAQIHDRFDQYSTPEFINWFMNSTFFSYDILEYLREYQTKGMVVGCRLHSNLLALAHGVPTLFLTYDERTQEIVDLLDIPHRRVTEFDDRVDLFAQDWKPFEQKYAHYYQELIRCLEANQLRHHMGKAAETSREDREVAVPVS